MHGSFGQRRKLAFCLFRYSAAPVALALLLTSASGQTAPASSSTATSEKKESDVITMETFNVEGYREGLAKAREDQRKATNLKNIVSVDAAGKLPDSNMAEAIQRVPGVYLQGTHGEGRYVSVRGIDPQLNNVTVNGLTIAASDVDGRSGRAAPLDIMGASAMSSVEVIKAPTPDMDGQGLGATINIVTPSAFSHKGPFAYGSAKVGINDNRVSGISDEEATLNTGLTFGSHNQFGLLIGVNYLFRKYNTADVAWETPRILGPGAQAYFGLGGVAAPFGTIIQAQDMSLKEFLGERARKGATANLEWHPNPDSEVWLRGYYTTFHEKLYEAHLRLRLNGLNSGRTIFTSPTSGFTTSAQVNTETTQDEVTRPVHQIVLGGKHKFAADWTIDGNINITQAREEKPGTGLYAEEFSNSNFRNGVGNVPSNAAMTFDTSGFFPVFQTAYSDPVYGWPGTGNVGDPSFYPLFRIRHEFSQVKEQTKTYDVNLKWDRDLGGMPGFLKMGVKYLDRKKNVNDKSMRYETKTALNGYSSPNIFLSDTFNGVPYGIEAANVFGGFPVGPAIYQQQLGVTDNPAVWEADFDQNVGRTLDQQFNEFTRLPDPAGVIKNPNRWAFRLNDSAANSIEDDYDLTEKLSAVYLMGNYNPTETTNVIAGARFEQAKSTVTAPIEKDNPDGTFQLITNGPYKKTFSSILPDVLLRWDANKNLQIRASGTTTVGRPDYIAMAPKGRVQIQSGPASNIFTGSLSVGNPDLKSYKSTNLDLSAAWYLPKRAGLLQVGVFYKDIKNPIYSFGYDPTASTNVDLSGTGITRNTVGGTSVVDFQGVHFATLNVSTNRNADSGKIKGLEITYQQDFTFLPSPFDGLGVSLNYTRINSEVTIFGRSQDTRFFLQPDLVENYEVYYEKRGFQARLGWHYQGDALAFIGSDPRLDEWLRARGQLDARMSFRVNQSWEVFLEGRNLSNRPYRTFWGFSRDSLSGQRNDYPGYELVGRSYYVGVNYSFGG